MRLHQLEITAFGPFAEPTTVDFDALSDAGLFLLSGPTGAGKSSVLDAVCFALYGDVPGDRAVAKRLRSDHAADRRRAARRPRGHPVGPPVPHRPLAGLDARQEARRRHHDRAGPGGDLRAARTGEDGDGDEWQPLSTRLDETGHLVTRLVGMTLTQFCQVAMLPQGRFQAFLRARSDERQALLQQVFQTGRFDEHRGLAARPPGASCGARRRTTRASSPTSSAGSARWPATRRPTTGPADPEGLRGWIGELTTSAVTASVEQTLRVDAASVAEVAASEASAAGIELAGRRATYAAARRARAAVEAATPEHDDRLRRSRRPSARPAYAPSTSSRSAPGPRCASSTSRAGRLARHSRRCSA